MIAKSSSLFSPARVGSIDVQHRIVMAPLTRFRATDDHVPLPMVAEYYAQRASVPGTLLIAEATQISPQHAGANNMPGIWSQGQIESWKKATAAVHAKGSKFIMQLIAPGRAANSSRLQSQGFDLLSSSAVPMKPDASTPSAMTEMQIEQAIDDFVHAAQNAIEAGFDGVEIHGANGYLVDQFTQDTANHRTDKWGGNVENRSRFGLEIARRVAEAIGKERVGYRISPFSEFQGMKMKDPVPQFTHLAKGLKDIDIAYLHVVESRIAGNLDTELEESIEFTLEAFGSRITSGKDGDKSKTALIAGGFTPSSAIQASESQYADFNTMFVFGRHFIANPDLPYRIAKGIELNKYDRSTFYNVGEARGYTDYSFSEQFLSEQREGKQVEVSA